MIKLLRNFLLLAVFLMPALAQAQIDTVTVKDLNTYPETPQSVEDIMEHPLAGTEVQFTAVVVSYPKSSGYASFTENTEDFPEEGGSISRIHIFVVDTTALTQGKEGMYMQIVETGGASPGDDDFAYFLEELQVGDIVNFIGRLTFYEGAAQFDVTQWDIDNNTNVIGNVEDEGYTKFASLLEPIIGVTVDMLNKDNGDGTSYLNYENYEKYANAFIEIYQAPVIARDAFDGSGNLIGRPNWVIAQNSASMYINDISLRFRNDKLIYRNSYNYRRENEDGLFEPPAVGSVVKIQGFMTVDDFAGNIGRITSGESAFKITPFEDGVLWFNGERFVDGEEGFSWPNHLEVLGVGPAFSNFLQTPESGITSTTNVAISIDVSGTEQPDMSTSSIDSVVAIYTFPGDTLRLKLTADGDTYSGPFPTFPNLSPVSYYLEAYDNNGLVGRYPEFGTINFFVSDGPIASFEAIQKTPDEKPGPSTLVGGEYELDINAIIVSDVVEDGVIVAHDKADAWGGIFLSPSQSTLSLAKGDSIHLTKGTVQEVNDVTYLTNVTLEVLSSGNDYDAAIPVITTEDIVNVQYGDEVEPYEGMIVKLEDVSFISYAGFGEFRIASMDKDTILVNDDFSVSGIGQTNFPTDFVDHIRLGATVDELKGFIYTSFGEPKIQPRNLSDVVGEEFTHPVLEFSLLSPEDETSVAVNGDIEITWEATEDYDGDNLSYAFALYDTDSTFIVQVPSDDDATAPKVTLTHEVVDSLLESYEVEVGESRAFLWNVLVSDGTDTMAVASINTIGYDGSQNYKDYAPLYYSLTLERAMGVSNEVDFGTPKEFSLEQNYPNPFNPSTQIRFNLPKAADVTLTVYDMLGRKVATLVNNEQMKAGVHQVKFDASGLASGIYMYRINAGTYTSTRRMMLIK